MLPKKIKQLSEALPTLIKPVHNTYIIAAVIILLAGFITSYWASQSVSNIASRNVDVLFAKEAARNQEAIREQLERYTDILRGGVGLFRASGDVSRQEWREFALNYEVGTKFPGLQTIGFVKVVPAADKSAFEERVRAEGFPDFKITPEEPARDSYVPIYYVEPTDIANVRAFGFDVSTDPTRNAAVERARDTGLASISDRVSLIQNDSKNELRGVIIYMPLYANGTKPTDEASRRQNIVGYVFAPIRVVSLLEGVNQLANEKSMGYRVYDGESTSSEHLLYESKAYAGLEKQPGMHRTTSTLDINGHKWTSVYVASDGLNSLPNSQEPLTVLITGIILSLLLAMLLYGIMVNRARQLTMLQHAEVLSAKDGLISLASHQLRTPATAVKQYVELVLEGYVGKLTKSQREMLSKAQQSNDRQLETIDQILYISRLDSGRLRLQMEPTDTVALVKEIIGEQQTTLAARKQKLELVAKSKVSHVPVDRRYARMCIENLLSNASKYTHEKGKIYIRVLETASAVAISVEDNGVGISKSEESKLFQKFVRLDNELSIEAGGSGVGLYLVKEIMRLHGGDVEVESVPGEGTTFTLLFPKPVDSKRGRE